MDTLKLVLGMIWASPITIPVFLLYVGPCWLFRWYRLEGWHDNALVWRVDGARAPSLLMRLWKGWAAQAMGNLIVMRREVSRAQRTLTHEQEHVRQVMRLGVFQPILYLAALAIGWTTAHVCAYHDNPFEVAARRAAGQDPHCEHHFPDGSNTES